MANSSLILLYFICRDKNNLMTKKKPVIDDLVSTQNMLVTLVKKESPNIRLSFCPLNHIQGYSFFWVGSLLADRIGSG